VAWVPGDAVFGANEMGGAYAEYLAVKPSVIARKPFEKVLREKVDVVFDLIGGDTQKRSFLVLKEGGHLVSAIQPVSQEETARYRVSGVMMRLAPSGDGLGRIARLLEEGTIRPDVATVYALQDAAQAWKDIAGNLPAVHGMSPSGPGAARRKSHGKIVLRVA
jgi:NADPH:quinone reductase-like Zn-dependent oxidoreductase